MVGPSKSPDFEFENDKEEEVVKLSPFSFPPPPPLTPLDNSKSMSFIIGFVLRGNGGGADLGEPFARYTKSIASF
jgi:hypothetical protein